MESLQPEAPYGRFSLAAEKPFLIFEARKRLIQITTAHEQKKISGDPLVCLESLLAQYYQPSTHFFGPGAFGFIAYEFGYSLQNLPCIPHDDLGLPDLWFAFYDRVTCLDHLTGSAPVIPAKAEIQAPTTVIPAGSPPSRGGIHFPPASFTRRQYDEAVQKTLDHIAAGNAYQINLSQRFNFPCSDNAWALYTALRQQHPTTLCAFLNTGDFQILCFSPELFLRKEGNRIETCPIKGTAAQSKNPLQNDFIRETLRRGEKELAEHIMIVDLERNDFGKISQTGTVKPEGLARVESCGKVHHLVSTVTGTLKKNTGLAEIMDALFPGGSVTGAPKRKAMEIIGSLEPVVRGVYTGALGWIGFSGNFIFNLPIRTLLMKDGFAHFNVGGGIVADSTAEKEYQEILDKGSIFLEALGTAAYAHSLS